MTFKLNKNENFFIGGQCYVVRNTAEEIEAVVSKIAGEIDRTYCGQQLSILCIEKGGLKFFEELDKHLSTPITYFPLEICDYVGAELEFKIKNDPLITNQNILVLDGLIVSGKTHLKLVQFIQNQMPKSVSIGALGVKTQGLNAGIPLNYVGFLFGEDTISGFGIGNSSEKCFPHILKKI